MLQYMHTYIATILLITWITSSLLDMCFVSLNYADTYICLCVHTHNHEITCKLAVHASVLEKLTVETFHAIENYFIFSFFASYSYCTLLGRDLRLKCAFIFIFYGFVLYYITSRKYSTLRQI